MSDKSLKVKVGAAADSSMANVFVPLNKASKDSKDQLTRDSAAAAAAIGGAYRTAGQVAASAISTGMEQSAQSMRKYSATSRAGFEDVKKAIDQLPASLRVVAQEAKKATDAMERTKARQALGLSTGPAPPKGLSRSPAEIAAERRRSGGSRGGQSYFANRIAFGAARGAIRGATGLAGDLASGLGVDLDAGSHFAKNVELEKRSVALSNSGYMPGQAGANGERQDPRALMEQIRSVATATGTDINEAADALQKFVGKTGDLDTGRKTFGDLAVLAKSTGASIADIASAAADVSNNLGDVPDKAAAVERVMRIIGGQGKLGAVEIKDLASQMAKIASVAPKFAGSTEHNIGIMGAIAQEARYRGGASSASQAATSVQSLTNTLTKGARVKEFQKHGVDIYERSSDGEKTGRFKDIQSIIVQSLQKTKGDSLQMGTMFADVNAKRAIGGFQQTYQDAYAGAKGRSEKDRTAAATKAVNEEFERLMHAQMNNVEVLESFDAAMKTSGSQAQVLNDQLSKAAQEVQNALMPAFAQLSPLVVQAANDFATLVKMATAPNKDDDEQIKGQDAEYNANHNWQTRNTNMKHGYVTGAQVKNAERGEDDAALKKAKDDIDRQLFQAQGKVKKDENEISHGRIAPELKHDQAEAARLQERSDKLGSEIAKNQAQVTQMLEGIKNGTMKVYLTNPADIKPAAPAAPGVAGDGNGGSTVVVP